MYIIIWKKKYGEIMDCINEYIPAKINCDYVLEVKEKFNFDYAHFLSNYDGKCYNIHGHTAKVSVEIHGSPGKDGFVIDFGIIKSEIKNIIDEYDHKILVSANCVESYDDEFVNIKYGKNYMKLERDMVVITGSEPTVEYISRRILYLLINVLKKKEYKNIEGISVIISEGEHNYCKVYDTLW